MEDRIGMRFESNNYGEFEIIGLGGRDKWGNQLYSIRFDHREYETEVIWGQIVKREVKNPFCPTIFGVGYIGHGDSKHSLYQRWFHMLSRCYNPEHPFYGDYGARGIRVSHTLHNFDNYRALLEALPGYDDPALTTIDRVDNDGDYTPNNLRWATPKEQRGNQRRRSDQLEFTAVSPDGKKFTSFDQSEFALEHGLTRQCINNCLNGHRKSHKGWVFRYKEVPQEV